MTSKSVSTEFPTTDPAVFSVNEFCAAHRIGRAFFYKLQREGRAPRSIKLGRRRLISREEAARWRHRMLAESEEAAQGSR